jgi:hypothetical protein
MRMSLLPSRACGLALACSAVLSALLLFAFAPAASAEQVSFQQVTPVGSYDAVPQYTTQELHLPVPLGNADYVTADGASVFFSTIGPFPGLPDTGGRLDILRASRTADGGWSTTWMSPGADMFFRENVNDRVFEAASADGTKVVFESTDQLDPSRVDCGSTTPAGGGNETVCAGRVYEYDASTGRTSLISRATEQPGALFDARFASASPDLGTVSWLTPEAMTPGVEDQNSIDVYSAREGAVGLVSAASGSTGSVSGTRVVWTQGTTVEEFVQPGPLQGPLGEARFYQLPVRNAHLVSADGSEVFFQDVRQLTAGAPGPEVENVYMRRGIVTTLLSSAARRTLPSTVAPSDSFFSDATPDGQRVFFETASQLTNGDNNEGVDVYEYDVPTGTVSLVSAVGNTETAAPEGTGSYYVTASADGSHVYLASRDNLDPNSAPAGNAWKLYERVGGRTRFIAIYPELADLNGETDVSSPNDGDVGCAGVRPPFEATNGRSGTFSTGGCDQVATMRATADGSRLLFESAQALTPGATSGLRCVTDAVSSSLINSDQNETGTGGAPGSGCNIYLYDDTTGQITLLSAGTVSYGAFLTDFPFPTSGNAKMTAPLNQPLLMSEDGSRVFFSSRDALVPGAVSGLQNIYMWSDGALTLVSPPGETADAVYDGNSADGSQVFFHSRQSLIPGADNHGQIAIYDAQLGDPPPPGPADPPPAPQPVASAPAQALTVNAAAVATPAASTVAASTAPVKASIRSKPLTRAQKLSKALKACKRDRSRTGAKRRAACEAQARKRYRPPSKAKRSNRGGSR